MTSLKRWLAVAGLLLALPASAQLVILQYHHVATDTPPSTSTTPDDFAAHLQLLADEQMVVVGLQEALTRIRAGETLPEKAVAITFDDAYTSVYSTAWPLLQARGWPFTVFVNPQAVDERVSTVMSWEQLQDLQNQGVMIANHTQSHPYLINVPAGMTMDAWLDKEINGAEKRLQEKLGTSHKLLAYPYGEFNLAITHWLQQQGYTALGQQSGPVGPSSHPQALPRFPAAGIYANPNTLKTKLYTRPFPISAEQFAEPVLSNEQNPPALRLTFPAADLRVQQIQCYSGSEGAIPTRAERNGDRISLHTQARKAIQSGRDRYNCTAPSSAKPGWYYWYSQFWINTAVSKR